MKKIYFLLIAIITIAGTQTSKGQWLESFTGQTNFGNPTGWSTFGFTTWNVYQTHGNPSFGLRRGFTNGQRDSIRTSDVNLITVNPGDSLSVDVRIMATSLYPSFSATLPSSGSLIIYGFDGGAKYPIITVTATNQNTDVNWITLKGSLAQFTNSQIQLIVSGTMGSTPLADDLDIDLDNFRIGSVPVGVENVETTKTAIYPNPASNKIYVADAGLDVRVTLSDILGNILETKHSDSNTEFDITALKAGVYFVKVENAITSTVQKVIVE